jgi:hypothetical protein
MSATELHLHDIDKLNNIVNAKLKHFVAESSRTNTAISPEVEAVLNSKVPGI